MTELGVTEEYLATKVSEDIRKCMKSCQKLLDAFTDMSQVDLREVVVDADAKNILTTFAPVIEQLSARLHEAELVPVLGKALIKVRP